MAKNGILFLKDAANFSDVLSFVQKYVEKVLYVQLLNNQKSISVQFWERIFQNIYLHTSKCADTLDVRLILSNFKSSNNKMIETENRIKFVFCDRNLQIKHPERYSKDYIANLDDKFAVFVIDTKNIDQDVFVQDANDSKQFNHVVLGGTFDRLHEGHKVLLSTSAALATDNLTVGVTSNKMTSKKVLCELIEPVETRMRNVKEFLKDIKPSLKYEIIAIDDIYGPTKYDPNFEAIVVSDETVKGAQIINCYRQEHNLCSLEIVNIGVMSNNNNNNSSSCGQEKKISSRDCRMDLLGRLLKPVRKPFDKATEAYVIGLTGSVASGKSTIAQKCEAMFSAKVINCDILCHETYAPGTMAFKDIIDEFGDQIVDQNGCIDRSKLGAIVFHNEERLNKLNAIVWPYAEEELHRLIKLYQRDHGIIVIEAAVLLKANWTKYCHEVWVTFVPETEAITRLQNRNRLSEIEAQFRLDKLPKNEYYIQNANVIFSTIWQPEVMDGMLRKAWSLLLQRIHG